VGLGIGSVALLNVMLCGGVEFVNGYGKVEPPGRRRAARNGVIALNIGAWRVGSVGVLLVLEVVVARKSDREGESVALEKWM
jgi:hypothetical protein